MRAIPYSTNLLCFYIIFQSLAGSSNRQMVEHPWLWRVRLRCRSQPPQTTPVRASLSENVPVAVNASSSDFCSKHWISIGTRTVLNVDVATVDWVRLGPRCIRRRTSYCADEIILGNSKKNYFADFFGRKGAAVIMPMVKALRCKLAYLCKLIP